MAKSVFEQFIASNPEEAWREAGKPKVDPVVGFRKKIHDWVDQAIKDERVGSDPKRGAFKSKGDKSRVVIKSGRQTLKVAGNEFNVVDRDKLGAFFDAVKRAIDTGVFDDQVVADAAPTEKKKDGRSTWTDERREKHKAALAAARESRQSK